MNTSDEREVVFCAQASIDVPVQRLLTELNTAHHRNDGGGESGDYVAKAAKLPKEPDDPECSHGPVRTRALWTCLHLQMKIWVKIPQPQT